jgi:hypothetical protein
MSSLIGTTQESRSSLREPRVPTEAPIRAADGGGEEVDEVEAGRKLPDPYPPVAS